MAKFFDALTPDHAAFIAAQPLFFVATAAAQGRINLSPKGIDGLRVLTPHRVAWLDITGSGNETAAHLRQDGRITVMLCSFGPKPLILRLYGTGHAWRPGDPGWTDLAPLFPDLPGRRQIMDMAVESVQTSCGFGVPEMDLRGQRRDLLDWAGKKGEDGIARYWRERNAVSIDGLETGLGE